MALPRDPAVSVPDPEIGSLMREEPVRHPMAGVDPARIRSRLDRALNGILLGIGVQFFLGMWLNLFGAFPLANSSFGGALTDGSDPILAIHTILGVFLLVGAIAVLVLSFRDHLRMIRWFTLTGLVGMILAGVGGSGFVSTGYSSALSSFLMAVGFAVALTGYYEGLVRLRTYPLPATLPTGSGTPSVS